MTTGRPEHRHSKRGVFTAKTPRFRCRGSRSTRARSAALHRAAPLRASRMRKTARAVQRAAAFKRPCIRGIRGAVAEAWPASQKTSFSTVKNACFCKRRCALRARVDACARTRRHGAMRCATRRRIEKLCIFFVANPNKWLEGIFEMLRMSASSVLMSVTRLLSSQRVIAAAMTRTTNQGSRKSARGMSRLAGRNGFEGVTRLRRSA